jgi:integrase
LTPIVVNTLREWQLACAKGDKGPVFPTGSGNVESHSNIVKRGLSPTLTAAGVAYQATSRGGKPLVDEEGNPTMLPKYTGLHAFRHFYASWCINRRVDGGLELPAKVVQERLGHSSIVMTMDVYGHLFKGGDRF